MAFLSFFSILVSMFLIDAIWLGIMVPKVYAPLLGPLLADSMRLLPGLIFYFLFAFALNIFVVLPALREESAWTSLWMMGALFGLVTYGTYDLTNLATLKNWPAILSVIDLCWGAILTGTVSVISVYITRYFI